MSKKILGLLVLTLLILSLVFLFASCTDNNSTDAQTDDAAESGGENEVEVLASDFSIFKDGAYTVRVILPEAATDIEKDIYDKVRNKLRDVTGIMPERVSDFKAYNDDGESRKEPAILVGDTNYDESQQVYASLGYTESRMTLVGNKLVLAFSSDIGAEGLYASLLGYLRGATKSHVAISSDINVSRTIDEFLSTLPKYPDKDHSMIELDNDTYMFYSSKSKTEGFSAYYDMLVEYGFSSVSSREDCGNRFETLTLEDKYAYMYYTAYNGSVRVIIGPKRMLASGDYDAQLEQNYTPYIASIPQPNQGQGYIFRLPDGRFIIQDGGYEGDDRVYTALRNLEPEEKITIAAWFISHPHSDHYPAFIDFIKDHGNDESIVVESVMFNYANSDMYNINGSAGVDNSGDDVELLYSSISQYAPSVPIIKLHTGQMLDFGCATVEILYTIEDLIPAKITNINDSSMVMRLNIAEDSIMILADTCYASGPILHNMWGEHLKSDIVQMAHHSMYPSVESIYHDIKAEVILHSAMYSGLKDFIKPTQSWAAVMEAAFSYAKDMHVSDSLGEVITLPYEIHNNKEEMLEYIENY